MNDEAALDRALILGVDVGRAIEAAIERHDRAILADVLPHIQSGPPRAGPTLAELARAQRELWAHRVEPFYIETRPEDLPRAWYLARAILGEGPFGLRVGVYVAADWRELPRGRVRIVKGSWRRPASGAEEGA